MLHMALGSGESLTAADGIRDKPADETAANGGTPAAHQGFDESTLNFVGRGGGFYTRADFIEILAYAGERHIDVIPEFDMPAHARAAVRSMEHRFVRYRDWDRTRATQYRLIDPDDTTAHTSVQGYVDNLMNPCLESTYDFVAKVVTEVRAMYAAARRPLVMLHVGGDEPPGARWWRDSPACKADPATRGLDDATLKDRFFARLDRVVRDTGATMAGWDDVLGDGRLRLPGFVAMPWSNTWGEGGEDRAYREANGGQPVVLAHATNLYMDLAYAKDPDEPGFDWANYVDEQRTFEYLPFDVFAIATRDKWGKAIPASRWASMTRLTPAGRANVRGIEGLLWSENVKSPEILEYMAFPKLLGVAERAWSRSTPSARSLPQAWGGFVWTLGRAILPRLDYFRPVDVRGELPAPPSVGVNYRIPLPGAVVETGVLRANVRYPGMAIEYSLDAGRTWTPYDGPVPLHGAKALVRARTSDGRPGRAAKVE
jgi:hexosaminidase